MNECNRALLDLHVRPLYNNVHGLLQYYKVVKPAQLDIETGPVPKVVNGSILADAWLNSAVDVRLTLDVGGAFLGCKSCVLWLCRFLCREVICVCVWFFFFYLVFLCGESIGIRFGVVVCVR